MGRMTTKQTEAFLSEPHIAVVATLQPDGSPHLTPVWHHFDSGKLMVLASPSTVKVRNIRRDPRVSLCVATDTKPYKHVQVSGTATISDEWPPEVLWSMAVNYLGREEGERYAERVFRETRFSLITVTPTKIIAVSEEG